jgi:ribosomal protein L11 methyltransferase
MRAPGTKLPRHATRLETVTVVVPEDALEAYEAALAEACGTVGFFKDDDTGLWHVEGVKDQGEGEAALASGLMIAALVTGFEGHLTRRETEAEGWLARTYQAFPEQLIGRHFAIRGTHLSGKLTPGRITLVLDAAIAFGSGEHGSTRGCISAFEAIARRRPRPMRILDLGTGTGILAMAAAKTLKRPVLGTDIEPWSVRVAAQNAKLNGLSHLLRFRRIDGWSSPELRGPYDLVFANILARPLCMMAKDLAAHLAPGGRAILAGLLDSQANWVLAAHRRQGLVLEAKKHEGQWTSLVLRKPSRAG